MNETNLAIPQRGNITAVPAITADERKGLTKKEIVADHPTWCPGCGDFSVLALYFKLIEKRKMWHEKITTIAGIGCSSRFPYFVQAHGAHYIHGRALPFASGISLSRPDLHVFVFGGDGDAFSGYGPIAAAEFNNAGRRVRAVRFIDADGKPAYYDERGVSMRRFFLASPLKFQPVVTSAFSRSRFHPILREYRAHLGVDYRAPAGAPVVAVSDGVVVSAGSSGGSGRMVHLRHPNGFESEYLHLSAITVHAGARVHQGELIGRVGSTGLATGPHLDYRLKKNGAFINPLTAHRAMPPADPVPAARMVEFNEVRDRAFAAFSVPAVTRAAR